MSPLDVLLEIVGWVVALVNLLLIGAIALLLFGTAVRFAWLRIASWIAARWALPAVAARLQPATPRWQLRWRRMR